MLRSATAGAADLVDLQRDFPLRWNEKYRGEWAHLTANRTVDAQFFHHHHRFVPRSSAVLHYLATPRRPNSDPTGLARNAAQQRLERSNPVSAFLAGILEGAREDKALDGFGRRLDGHRSDAVAIGCSLG